MKFNKYKECEQKRKTQPEDNILCVAVAQKPAENNINNMGYIFGSSIDAYLHIQTLKVRQKMKRKTIKRRKNERNCQTIRGHGNLS